MAGIIVIFDFDKTIIDIDSDNLVVDELGATDLFNQLLPTIPWNTLMDKMMLELQAQGKTIEDMKEALRRAPIHPRIVPAIKKAHALGCDLRIVSDANTLFIDTILDHLGIRNCFSEINTNPSYIDREGRFRVSPFVAFHVSPHGCNLCPQNMCKGKIIERIQAKEGGKRIIYLGDGVGDFCPCLKLKETDFMMPRRDFPVWDLICQNRAIVRSKVCEWTDGEELERILLIKLTEMMKIEESINDNASSVLLPSIECKFVSVPSMVELEVLTPVLKVNQ